MFRSIEIQHPPRMFDGVTVQGVQTFCQMQREQLGDVYPLADVDVMVGWDVPTNWIYLDGQQLSYSSRMARPEHEQFFQCYMDSAESTLQVVGVGEA